MTTIERDNIVCEATLAGDQATLDAHLADLSRLWPSGVAKYKFYDTFPAANQEIVLRGMEYITSKVSCITFRKATELKYDLIQGGNGCKSEVGQTGGVQNLARFEQVKVMARRFLDWAQCNL